MPGAKVTGSITNPGDFEVTVNGQLIFSKKSTGTFPDPNAVSLSQPLCGHAQYFTYHIPCKTRRTGTYMYIPTVHTLL